MILEEVKMKGKIALIIAIVGVSLLLSGSILGCAPAAPEGEEAGAELIVYRFEHVTAHKPADPPTVVAAEFARFLNEATDGRVVVKCYGEGEVHGSVHEMAIAQSAGELEFSLVNLGDVAAAVGAPEYEIACRVPTFGVHWKDLLLAYDDFWADPAGGGVVSEIFAGQGILIMGTHTSGFVTLSCSTPAVTADEWDGLKIRYPGGAVAENIILAVGATPVQIPWSEAQMALKTGVADGIITDSAYFRYRLWELGPKYLSNVVPLCYLRELAVSTKALEKMPADVRQALEGMMPEFNTWCKEWNIAFTDKTVSDTEPFFERYELTDAAFKAAADKMDAAMLGQFEELNPDLLAVWHKVISKYQ